MKTLRTNRKALVLVAALYVAMDVEFRTMQGGRDVVMGGQLARGLFGRMTADVRESLALLPSMAAQQLKAINAASGTSSSGTGGSTSSTAVPPGQFSSGIVGSESQIAAHASVELGRGAGRRIGLGADRQHRHRMANRGELSERTAAHALRR